MKKSVLIIVSVIVFLFFVMVSYIFFSRTSLPGLSSMTPQPQKRITNDYDAIVFDVNAKKTESCPLTDVLYSKEQKEWWESHRPLGVMIENHLDARPQSGLSFADIVYEAVAEGGITRFLAVFYCQDAGIIGPVRSARTYFLDYISEYGSYPLYAHVGGANAPGPADALGQIGEYGWNQYNDLNQFSIGFPTFKRDQSRLGRQVATEHTMYSITNKLWDFAVKERGLTNKDKSGDSWDDTFVSYSFKNDEPASTPNAKSITIDFWNNPNYEVEWVYDSAKNNYLRNNGGVPHVDRNTNKQITAKNVVVLFMKESTANDGYQNNVHQLFGTIGSGQALIFMDGKEITGTWKKSNREARTLVFDRTGNEIKFNRGSIWFEIQPLNNDVIVK